MKFYSAILVVLVALSGCATTPPGVADVPSDVIVPPGMAKVVITRNSDALFLGAKARIDVNGQRVAELWRGERYAGVVQPGSIVLATDAWGVPGNFLAHFKAEADKEYTFEASPRRGHWAIVSVAGIVGSAVVAAVDENTGPFSIYLKDEKPLQQVPMPNRAVHKDALRDDRVAQVASAVETPRDVLRMTGM